MKTCPRCGKSFPDDVLVCPNCGQTVEIKQSEKFNPLGWKLAVASMCTFLIPFVSICLAIPALVYVKKGKNDMENRVKQQKSYSLALGGLFFGIIITVDCLILLILKLTHVI